MGRDIQSIERGTYTAEEAFVRLGCGRTLGYEMIRDGRLPSFRLGRKVLIPRAAIERMLSGTDSPDQSHSAPGTTEDWK